MKDTNSLYFVLIVTGFSDTIIPMKRILTISILFFVGMAIQAQDLSYYNSEYTRSEATFADRLSVLELLQEAGITVTGEFYHNALRFLLARAPDINSRNEQEAAERSVIILSQGLGAAKYTAAAADLWHAVEVFDVAKESNEGNALQAALVALADVDARQYIAYIIQRLDGYNAQTFRNPEARRRFQTAVIGCVRSLEIFKDASGYRPVFFVYVGSYDPMVRQIAANALPVIAEDPADVIIGIIRNPSVEPPIKLQAWKEMLNNRAPNPSKARVAATALEIGWTFSTANRTFQANLRELRRTAIDAIRQYGAANDAVYADLEKAYAINFAANSPDYDEMAAALNALAALKTDEAVALLHKFLQELNNRRRTGPWRAKERQLLEWVLSCVGITGTRDQEVRLLLRTIQSSSLFTTQERSWAQNALTALGF